MPTESSSLLLSKWYPWWVAALVVSFIPGLFTPLMDQDAALYAGIAKQMAWRNDWVNLYALGTDWLDKPHLPFWLSAFSFKIFGISTFAYKLPGLLCWLIGAWYTGLFARHFYGRNAGRAAVLIYLGALHAIISANDVRAEPYLTLFLIAASWHLVKAHNRLLHIFPAAFFSALALMTKGPFTLIPIGGGLVIHWLIRKEWKQFIQWKWYAYLLITAVFTLPEIWTLYLQFDSKPDKIVFGQTGVSGIRFFVWDSQFGRFFNTGPIKGKGDPFFFLHTLLWAFLPWSLLFYAALIRNIKRLFSSEEKLSGEWLSFGAGVLTLVVFSLSRFQLPHYLNILFPYYSILLAAWLVKIPVVTRVFNRVWITQRVVSLLMIVLPVAVVLLFRPMMWWMHIALTLGFLLLWWQLRGQKTTGTVLRTGIAGSLAMAVFLNIFFYPALLEYQGGSEAAGWKNMHHPGEAVYFHRYNAYSFEFYSDGAVLRTPELPPHAALVCTDRAGKVDMDTAGIAYKEVKAFPSFPVTRLNGKFLNPATRASRLDSVWLLRVNPVESNILEKK